MIDISTIAAKYEIDQAKLAGALRMQGLNVETDAYDGFAKTAIKLVIGNVVAARAQKARWTAPKMTKEAIANPTIVCGKCDGAGKINAFGHVSSGVCFQCKEHGIIRKCGA